MEFAHRRGALVDMRAVVEEVYNPPGLLQTIPRPAVRKIHTDSKGQRWIVTQFGVPYLDSFQVTQSVARKLEVRPGDHASFRALIIEPQIKVGPSGPEPGYLVEFNGANGPQRLWLRDVDMTWLEERPETAPGTNPEAEEAPGGAKARAVAAAIDTLWPEGIPDGLAGKDRDNCVREWIRAKGLSAPTNIARAVQRVLAEREA